MVLREMDLWFDWVSEVAGGCANVAGALMERAYSLRFFLIGPFIGNYLLGWP